MKREVDAVRLLHGLLDRHECRNTDARRIIAYPSQAFATTEVRDRLYASLEAAAAAGAVRLEWDRDASHLIARVILDAPAKLYLHLGRPEGAERQASAAEALAAYAVTTSIGAELRDLFQQRWAIGKTFLAFPSAKAAEAVELIRAADAAFTDLGVQAPLRTRSTRLLGDSKALERNMGKLLAFLRYSGRLDPDLDRESALQTLGLAKFPQPVLLAGPLCVDGMDIGQLPYLGIPPETVGAIGLACPAPRLLTIENLESFHRHVREARGGSEIIVYTGGFPAQGVVHLLRHLIALGGLEQFHHWGDIDAGGIRIGRYLETALGIQVLPHLMTQALATSRGKRTAPNAGLITIPASSSFRALALFLASEEACTLEQEMLEPVSLLSNAPALRPAQCLRFGPKR